MKPTFARLHILLAREAPIGLVIRHGTAQSVCTLLWDRKKDEFTLGQWMRGRIDLPLCDLAPDGQHFLYRASGSRPYTVSKYVLPTWESTSWAVVSRTPYLKAVAYYPRGWASGWFVNSHEYCVQAEPSPDDRESPEVRRVEAAASTPPGNIALSLYEARLVRDGWTADDRRAEFKNRLDFVRPAGAGWELRHFSQGGYMLSREQLLADTRDWDWAGMDGDRLVWTEKGCLWAGVMDVEGIKKVQLLHDFNGMKFEALAAPYEGGQPVPPRRVVPPPSLLEGKTRKHARAPVRKKPNRSKVRRVDEPDLD